jgi:penicillin-binding protein 2
MQFEDTGKIKAGPIEFGNWYFLQYGKTEGMVNITRAIKRSNDIYFYRAGARLGPERIKYWSGQFGYGRRSKSAFDEAAGLIPSPFWKEETVGDRWYLGDTYNLAIGQGYVLVTPLQATLATSVFASGGELCEPKLLKDEKPECKKIPIAPDTLDIVTEGMKQACAPGGTGWPLFDFKIEGRKIDIACKTGTAESLDKKTAPHAWITLFAPIENPEIVLTVMVEQGGQGSDVAGPIAREILKTYFGRKE